MLSSGEHVHRKQNPPSIRGAGAQSPSQKASSIGSLDADAIAGEFAREDARASAGHQKTLTGAKVFRVFDLYDQRIGPRDPQRAPSVRGGFFQQRGPIRLSDLYYAHSWRVYETLRAVYLASPQQFTLWERPYLKAKLKEPRVNPGNGIHAYRNLAAAVYAQRDQDHQVDHPGSEAAYGIVRAEGQCVIGDCGWVAEAVTIERIFLMPQTYLSFARILYDRYRVPVEPLPRSLRERPALKPAEEPWIWKTFTRKYGPGSGVELWRRPIRRRRGASVLVLYKPALLERPANLVRWDPEWAAWQWQRLEARARMTARDYGRLGGEARGRLLRAGKVAVSGAAVARPTVCVRCGEELSSARAAWRHCRGRVGRPRKV